VFLDRTGRAETHRSSSSRPSGRCAGRAPDCAEPVVMNRTTTFQPFRAGSRLARAFAVGVPAVALVVGLSALPAPAETATTPISSWGTAKASNGRAQAVLAIVAGDDGTAYFGGAFTKLVGPGGSGSATRSHLAAVD